MALQPIQGVTERWKEDADGDMALVIAPFASVAVYNESDGALAPLFAERDGLSGLPNPLTSDEYGRFSCYTAIDRVKIVVTTAAGEIGLYRNVATGLNADEVVLQTQVEPKALVKLNSALSVATTTITTVNWESEVYDTDDFWDVGTPSRLTCPKAGYVQLSLTGDWSPSDTNSRFISIQKNGSSAFDGSCRVRKQAKNSSESILVSPLIPVVQGDYFTAVIFQDSGVASNFGPDYSFFGISYVR